MTPREMPCRHALQVSRAAAMYLGFKCDATSARVSGGRKFHKESCLYKAERGCTHVGWEVRKLERCDVRGCERDMRHVYYRSHRSGSEAFGLF